MKILRAIGVVALLATATTAIGLWLWIRPDVVRVKGVIDSAQAPLPKRLLDAMVAVEDPGFRTRTRGHSLGALERAIVAASSRRRLDAPLQGASLTERIVGWQTGGRPVSRFARQLLVVSIVDYCYDDTQIATAYANLVYLGRIGERPIYGVPAAASLYFGRAPSDLSLPQLVSLVAAIRNPNMLSPLATGERALSRRRTVLAQIVSAGLATPAEGAAAALLARGGI